MTEELSTNKLEAELVASDEKNSPNLPVTVTDNGQVYAQESGTPPDNTGSVLHVSSTAGGQINIAEKLPEERIQPINPTDVTQEELASHIVFLGAVDAGKTSLANTLAEMKLKDPTDTVPTKGVDFEKKIFIDVSTEEHGNLKVCLQAIDFGGHKSYHLMQHFFISESTLYVLVVDIFRFQMNRKDYYNKVGYWLDVLKAQTVDPIVSIVASHIDEIETGQSEKDHEKKTFAKLNYIIKQLHDCESKDIQALKDDKEVCEQEKQKQENFLKKVKKEQNSVVEEGGTVDTQKSEDFKKKFTNIQMKLQHCNDKIRRLQARLRNRPKLPNDPSHIFYVNSKEKDEKRSGRDKIRNHISDLINNHSYKFCEPLEVGAQCHEIERFVTDLEVHVDQNYFTFEEIFAQVAKFVSCDGQNDEENVRAEIKLDLIYLYQKGSIIYLSDYPNFIFHNKQWLNEVMVAVFSHEKCRHDWNPSEEDLEDRFEGIETIEVKDAVEIMKKHGIIYEKLLKCLLKDVPNFKETDFEVIINLLKAFDLCYELELTDHVNTMYVYANSKENRLFAFPYLLKFSLHSSDEETEQMFISSTNTDLTEEMEKMWIKPTPKNRLEYAILFRVTPGYTPMGVFERFSVALNDHAAERYDGKSVTLARLKESPVDDFVCVMETFDPGPRLTYFVLAAQVGSTTKSAGKDLYVLSKILKNILRQCPGAPYTTFVICGGCLQREETTHLWKKIEKCGRISERILLSPEDSYHQCGFCGKSVRKSLIFPVQDFVRAEEKYEDRLNRPCYPMPNSILGFALIINNYRFTEGPHRDGIGPEQEGSELQSILTKIGFRVKLFINLTKKQMEDAMKDFISNEPHKDANCVFVAIISHGDEHGICGTDKIPYNVQFFKQGLLLHDDLKGKPKIFVIDGCRGHSEEIAASSDKAEAGIEHDITLWSAVEGYYSYMHEETGSFLMKHLKNVLLEYYESLSVDDMFTEVIRRVGEEKIKIGNETFKQTCNKYTTAYRQVKLCCDLRGVEH